MNIAIIGYGEIGKSLEQVYRDYDKFNLTIIDKDYVCGGSDIDIMNICLPLVDFFDTVVINYIKKYKPKLCIIHTSTTPGITERISEKVGCAVVHSPVRGVHPNLYEGLKTFKKYIGYINEDDRKLCENHFKELEIDYESIKGPANTELAKLYSTTYYGLCIAFHGEMKKHFDSLNLNYDIITDWNKTYNSGYTKLGKEGVIRPVLIPPDKSIGGHCVIPNTELLRGIFESKAFDLILNYKNKDDER